MTDLSIVCSDSTIDISNEVAPVPSHVLRGVAVTRAGADRTA
jgi:hypothetical protein